MWNPSIQILSIAVYMITERAAEISWKGEKAIFELIWVFWQSKKKKNTSNLTDYKTITEHTILKNCFVF